MHTGPKKWARRRMALFWSSLFLLVWTGLDGIVLPVFSCCVLCLAMVDDETRALLLPEGDVKRRAVHLAKRDDHTTLVTLRTQQAAWMRRSRKDWSKTVPLWGCQNVAPYNARDQTGLRGFLWLCRSGVGSAPYNARDHPAFVAQLSYCS